jgi:SAM-dependent methyltransferase
VRKAIWRLWYPYLTRRLRGAEVLFLNYAFETVPPAGIALDLADEPDRACIQLYHHVAAQVELCGKAVAEVSCGHGGGTSWITRSMHPASYVGLDLNPAGIAFCQRRHRIAGLTFVQGDAQNLPFADGSLDVVINVEASHCYPDFTRFLAEVRRVLRPGGHFLHADFRFGDDIATWQSAIAAASLKVIRHQDISREVLRGMEVNGERNRRLVCERLPGLLKELGSDFAAVPGSRVHAALESGAMSYQSWCLRKAQA